MSKQTFDFTPQFVALNGGSLPSTFVMDPRTHGQVIIDGPTIEAQFYMLTQNVGSTGGSGLLGITLPEQVVQSILSNGFDGRASGIFSSVNNWGANKPFAFEALAGQQNAILRKHLANGETDSISVSDLAVGSGALNLLQGSIIYKMDWPGDCGPFRVPTIARGDPDMPILKYATQIPDVYYNYNLTPPLFQSYIHIARSKVFNLDYGDELHGEFSCEFTWDDPMPVNGVYQPIECVAVLKARRPWEFGPMVFPNAGPDQDPTFITQNTGENNFDKMHHLPLTWEGFAKVGTRLGNGLTFDPGPWVIDVLGYCSTGRSNPGTGAVILSDATFEAWAVRY